MEAKRSLEARLRLHQAKSRQSSGIGTSPVGGRTGLSLIAWLSVALACALLYLIQSHWKEAPILLTTRFLSAFDNKFFKAEPWV